LHIVGIVLTIETGLITDRVLQINISGANDSSPWAEKATVLNGGVHIDIKHAMLLSTKADRD